MVLQINREQIPPDIIVLQVAGKLVLGRDAKELEWVVDELVRTPAAKIILDVTDLNFVDSTGIGIIVMCSSKVKGAGGQLRVAGSRGMVDEVLRRTRIDSIVPFHTSRDLAAQSLKSS